VAEDLHVVFGAGQIGRGLVNHLARLGLAARAVSRRRPIGLDSVVQWRAAEATDPDAATEASAGATVIYQCLNAPYTRWPQVFPPMQRGVLSAAERTGALLVTLENLYGYGPTGGRPMTEDLPLAATTVKGSIRTEMTQELLAAADQGRLRIAIGRASDFFGPGVTESTLDETFFGNAIAGRPAKFLGNPDLLHSYSYVPDVVAGLATLGTDRRAIGQVWHLPIPETVTTRAILALVAREIGRPVGIRSPSRLARWALALANPMRRALAEMAYEVDQPFVVDTGKYRSTFGAAGTPLAEAIAVTVAGYRSLVLSS